MSLSKPNIPGIELPELPLPWEWGKRMDITNEIGMTAIRSQRLNEESRTKLKDYLDLLFNRYIVPRGPSSALQDSVRFDSPLSKTIFTTHNSTEYTDMMHRFEQDFLGLPPNGSKDGLRWWESGAGFSGGTYPTESIAGLFDITSEQLLTHVKTWKPGMGGWVTIRAGAYFIPVTANRLGDETVLIGGVKELTSDGQEYVETILQAYERGYNDSRLVQ